MSLPDWLQELLPGDAAATWETISPLVPSGAYLAGGTAIAVHLRHRQSRDLDFFFHEGTIDLDALVERLRAAGPFAITERTAGTLNGVFAETRVQFLDAGLEKPQRRLEPTTPVCGIQVAGIGDLLAMKLSTIAGRAQLRDYFDVMTIEQQTGRTVEEGLALFLARYQPVHAESAITPILLALGYLEDVADDPFLPLERDEIVHYWQKRQPQIVAAVERYGISRLPQLDPASLANDSPPIRPRGPELEL